MWEENCGYAIHSIENIKLNLTNQVFVLSDQLNNNFKSLQLFENEKLMILSLKKDGLYSVNLEFIENFTGKINFN